MVPVLKCGCLDLLFGLLPGSPDPDQILAFQTQKVVRINDRVIGCFSHICTIAIVLYLIFDMYMDKTYLAIETPIGTSKLGLMMPPYAYTAADPVTSPCADCAGTQQADMCPPGQQTGKANCKCPTAWPIPTADMDLQYCSSNAQKEPSAQAADGYVKKVKMPCLYWEKDDPRYYVPMVGPQMIVTTMVEQGQLSMTCDKAFGDLHAIDPNCIQTELEKTGSGRMYPPPATDGTGQPISPTFFKGFVAGVEKATIKLDHTVSGTVNVNLEKRLNDMDGYLHGCDEAVEECADARMCGAEVRKLPKAEYNANFQPFCDLVKNRLFALDELLAVASIGIGDTRRCGLKLDSPSMLEITDKATQDECRGKDVFKDGAGLKDKCKSTVRYTGIVLIVTINYDNTLWGAQVWDEVDYRIHVKALPLSEAEIQRVSLTGKQSPAPVFYESRKGVLVMVQQEGRLGKFKFQAMLLNLTAGLGLLAVAKVITLFVAKSICPRITGDQRYKSLIVQESPDFNEEKEGGGTIEKGLLDNSGDTEMQSADIVDLKQRVKALEDRGGTASPAKMGTAGPAGLKGGQSSPGPKGALPNLGRPAPK